MNAILRIALIASLIFSLPVFGQELGETLRAIVGFEQSGASSAQSAQRFFTNFYVSIPFPVNRNAGAIPDATQFRFGPRVRLFTDFRLTTVPQQVRSGVGEFVGQFAQQVAAVKVNEIAQATEFQAGTEIRLAGMNRALKSFDDKTLQRFTVNLLLQAGATTPLTPRDSLEVFDIRPDTLNPTERVRLEKRYPQVLDNGIEYAAFTTQDRDRFFRQYYGGFRFKTYYFGSDDKRLPRFPSTLDILFGGNEAVTGGRFRGGIVRIDFFQSIPVEGKFGSIFFYGSFLMKPARSVIADPLLLRPATGVSVPGRNVAMIFVPQINRDFYRIGVGVELLTLFRELVKPMDGPRVN